MTEHLKLKLIGVATLAYTAGFMAIAAIGYLLEEFFHVVKVHNTMPNS